MSKARSLSRSRDFVELVSRSAEETHNLGIWLAKRLSIPSVVLLRGALGTGKTTLARGVAIGLGLEDPFLVNSPSFTLVNIYHARCPIYHVDLYRLESERDLYSTGMDEFFGEDGITVVEWSERLLFPAEAAVVVEFEDAGGDSRIIRVAGLAIGNRRALVASRKKDVVRAFRSKTGFRQRRTKECEQT